MFGDIYKNAQRVRSNVTIDKSKPTFRINEFFCGWMQRNALVGVVGKRRSGKSFCLRQIAYDMNPRKAVAFCGGREAAEFMATFIPDTYVYEGFHPEIIKGIMIQNEDLKSMKEMDEEIDTDMQVYVDDLACEPKVMKSPILKQLAANGRHNDVFVCVTVQYQKHFPPDVRMALDYLFAYKNDSRAGRKAIFDEFFSGVFKKPKVFDDVLNESTKDYKCLVKDSTVPTSNVEECVFYFRAQLHLPTFQIGDAIYLGYHRMFYQNTKASNEKRLKMQIIEAKKARMMMENKELDEQKSEMKKRKGPTRPKNKQKKNQNSGAVNVNVVLVPRDTESKKTVSSKNSAHSTKDSIKLRKTLTPKRKNPSEEIIQQRMKEFQEKKERQEAEIQILKQQNLDIKQKSDDEDRKSRRLKTQLEDLKLKQKQKKEYHDEKQKQMTDSSVYLKHKRHLEEEERMLKKEARRLENQKNRRRFKSFVKKIKSKNDIKGTKNHNIFSMLDII